MKMVCIETGLIGHLLTKGKIYEINKSHNGRLCLMFDDGKIRDISKNGKMITWFITLEDYRQQQLETILDGE